MAVYRAKVTRVTASSVWVRVPDLAGNRYEFGPLIRPTGLTLAAGSSVLVGGVGDVRDDIVVIGGQGGGLMVLAQLDDVALSTPSDGDVLMYDGTSWVNQSLPGSPTYALDDLTDVVAISPSADQLLTFVGGFWVPADKPDYSLGELTDVLLVSPSTGEVFYYDGTQWTHGVPAISWITGLQAALDGLTPQTRTISTTAPLAGGGDLSANRTLSLNDDGVTNAKLANVPTQTFKGRTTAGTGNPEDLTLAQARDLLALPNEVGTRWVATSSISSTSTSYADITGASVSFTKRAASTKVKLMIAGTWFFADATGGGYMALRINGTDYTLVNSPQSVPLNMRVSLSGWDFISGIPAGPYTVQARWRANVSGKAVQMNVDDDYLSIAVAETYG